VLAADGFEKVELVVPLRALQVAGAKVDIVSLRKGRIRGVNLHMPASRVGVDKVVTEADPDAYDGLLLPGGFINPDLLRQSAAARDFVRAFDHSGKPIVTLCQGPWVLASAGLLMGRTLTSWPGIRDDVINSGATWLAARSCGIAISSRVEGPRTCGRSCLPCSTSLPSRRVNCRRSPTKPALIHR
jgi:protease I